MCVCVCVCLFSSGIARNQRTKRAEASATAMDHVKEKEEGGGGGEPVLKKLAIKNPAQGFEDFEYKVSSAPLLLSVSLSTRILWY